MSWCEDESAGKSDEMIVRMCWRPRAAVGPFLLCVKGKRGEDRSLAVRESSD